MRNNIAARPNPALAAWLVGPECLRIINHVGGLARDLYVANVANRTGRLASAAHVEINVSVLGSQGPEWVVDLVVDATEAEYAASHNFGTQYQSAANDLNRVLSELGSL